MFLICMLFAKECIKEQWIKVDSHPVYNSRVHAIPMGGFRGGFEPRATIEDLRDLEARLLETKKQIVVDSCALSRYMIDTVNRLLNAEAISPNPDAKTIAALQELRTKLQVSLVKHAVMLELYPELEKRIEEAQLKLKQKQD